MRNLSGPANRPKQLRDTDCRTASPSKATPPEGTISKNNNYLATLKDELRRADELEREGAEPRAQVENLVEEARRLRSQRQAISVKPNIYVIDDDLAFCSAMVRLLSPAGFQVRAYCTANDFLREQIPDDPGCILLELHLPGGGGLEIQRSLSRQANPLPIIFISGDDSLPNVVRAMKAGAVDFLTKPLEYEILLDAINRSLALFSRQQEQRRLIAKWTHDFQTLSHRETEVFELVVAGKMNKEIASELGISLRTVKAHRSHVMVKMRVDSLAELVHIAASLPRSASGTST